MRKPFALAPSIFLALAAAGAAHGRAPAAVPPEAHASPAPRAAAAPTEAAAPAPPALDLATAEIVDLTWPLGPDTLYWPTSPSRFELETLHHGPTEGGFFYAANRFCTPEHGGTHLDAPIHFGEGRHAADEIPVERLIGPGVVVDTGAQAAADADHRLTVEALAAWEAEHGRIPEGAIVLLRTGWSARWPDARRYLGDDTAGDASNLHFPSYGAAAARWLIEERGAAVLGVDTASIDHGPSTDFPVHRLAAAANVPGIENLKGLEELPARGFWVVALPVKIAGGSGGPVRVVALVPGGARAADASSPAGSLARGSAVLELDGHRIHYEIHGEGPPLMVMPNPWGVTTTALRNLFGGLEAGRTLVLFDPRGMGGSSPAADDHDRSSLAVHEDFEALRRHLGLGRVDALGWSAGATALLAHALDRPDSLRSAVIAHTVARYRPEDGESFAARHPELVAAHRAFLKDIAALPREEQDRHLGAFQMELSLPNLFADPEAGRRHLEEVFGDMRWSWPHMRQVQQNESFFDLHDRLPELRVPLLVLAGAHDVLPPDRVRQIAELAPDARYALFEHSGHFAQLEEPAAFVRTVEEFLSSPAPTSRREPGDDE